MRVGDVVKCFVECCKVDLSGRRLSAGPSQSKGLKLRRRSVGRMEFC